VIASVTVFCGSSDLVEEKYLAAARELGAKLARRGWRLVYGGGSVGLFAVVGRIDTWAPGSGSAMRDCATASSSTRPSSPRSTIPVSRGS